MPSLAKLKADHAAMVKRRDTALAQERLAQVKLRKEEARLTAIRQRHVGACVDAHGLGAISLETWQVVCRFLATVGTTDTALRAWVVRQTPVVVKAAS